MDFKYVRDDSGSEIQTMQTRSFEQFWSMCCIEINI